MRTASSLLLMGTLTWCQAALAVSPEDLSKILHRVEDHYNHLKSLQVNFTETLISNGGRHRPQTGTLYLEKPRRMLWEYSSTAGKFFLSDGELTYDYDPLNHRVDQRKLKEADDLRGPLAFLLGKLDFNRDFKEYQLSTGGSITAIPKNANMPYTEVTFTAAPDGTLQKLSVKAPEGTLDYTFSNEQDNPPLKPGLFKFAKPGGAVVIDQTHDETHGN